MKKDLVSIVISVYNEEGNILELYKQINFHLQKCQNIIHELIFVNDGSRDKSLDILKSLAMLDKKVRVVNFARNFGHELAMTAGLDYANGEAVIFMDADLQHPPELLPEIIKKWQDGHEVVLTKIIENHDKGIFKKILSYCFYKFINLISETKIAAQTPDFRLINRRYVNILQKMRENTRMFRGMLDWLGIFNEVAEISFIAPKRFSGKSNYNLVKSFRLAVDSILQFSIKPLRVSIYFSIICALISVLFGAWTIYEHYVYHQPGGYATVICLIVFLSSLQFVILGIIGEYIGRIHIESKNRPLYFAEIIEKKEDENQNKC
jgi:dolichol-phosphate mannosyltransferase